MFFRRETSQGGHPGHPQKDDERTPQSCANRHLEPVHVGPNLLQEVDYTTLVSTRGTTPCERKVAGQPEVPKPDPDPRQRRLPGSRRDRPRGSCLHRSRRKIRLPRHENLSFRGVSILVGALWGVASPPSRRALSYPREHEQAWNRTHNPHLDACRYSRSGFTTRAGDLRLARTSAEKKRIERTSRRALETRYEIRDTFRFGGI